MLTKPLFHNRLLARALLYCGGVVVLAAVVALAVWLRTPAEDVSWDRPVEEYLDEESIRILQDFLRIDTSFPDGNEIPGAELLAQHLEAAGIETHIERLGSRNANLWAVIEGADPGALVLHNHIDVEPIRFPDQWSYEPFGGEIDPPWIFGRGAFDMKSVTVAQLMAMLELARDGRPLRRSLMFLATSAEETGSRLGTRRLLRQHPELVERMWAVLTEGGAVEARLRDEVKYWGTEFAQKRYLYVEACHGDPRRLERLKADLGALDRSTFRQNLSPMIAEYLEQYSRTRDNARYRELLAEPEALISDPARFAELPWYLQLHMQHEVAPFQVEPDPEGGYKVRIILHLLADSDPEQALAELLPEHLMVGIPYTVEIPHSSSPPSPVGHPLFQMIDEVVDTEVDDLHGPLFVPLAATDARFFRARGIPAYGFSPFLILTTDTLQATGPNERIALVPFLEGVERYRRVVERVVGSNDADPPEK